MRTERFRQILENSGNIAPKRFASKKTKYSKTRASVCWFRKTIEAALFLRFRTDQGWKPRKEIYAKTNKTAGAADRRAAASTLSAEITRAGILQCA